MDPLAPVSAWTFDDDYEWLKDAFEEAGTSFESLNKGAVHFSPRFSFQEPGDPWDSLTYDANASVEPSPQNVECLDSISHVLEYEGEKSGHESKVNDDATVIYDPMLKRIRNSVVENGDNTRSTNYVHGQEKENHFASQVSNSESLRQQFPYFETDSDVAAFKSLTESWEFEEAGHFCLEAETLVKFDDTSLIYGDIDVGNIGDSFTLGQIPTENTNESILELTLPADVQGKESAANSADFPSAGDGNNSEFMDIDVHSDAMDEIPCHNMDHFVPSTDGNLAAGSSASIMDLSELEELLFTDIDGNDTANIPNLDSFLLDFTSDENITNVVECSSTSGGCACSRDDINNWQFMNCYSESAILRSTTAANPELPPCISDINILSSEPVANNSEIHFASPPEAQILSSKPKDPSCCVLNTQDTEIPCNDDADFTRSLRLNRRVWRRLSSTNKYQQLRGIKTYYLAEEKPDSSGTIQSKKAVFKGDSIRESPKESLDSPRTIQSDILSELGINLPFMRRGV